MTDIPEDGDGEERADDADPGVSLHDDRVVDPGDPESGDGAASDEATDDRDAPLADLRRDVEERRDAAESDEFDDRFTDVDVGTIDEDEVWEALADASDEPLYTSEGSEAGRDVSVVQKRLCHRCPHFADPPELACTHDGTEIDAEVDTEQFRVLDCPMVDRPENAGASGFSGDDA